MGCPPPSGHQVFGVAISAAISITQFNQLHLLSPRSAIAGKQRLSSDDCHVQDWLLIALSVLLFHAEVTRVNLGGYLLAFGGVCWYNYQKLQGIKVTPPWQPLR